MKQLAALCVIVLFVWAGHASAETCTATGAVSMSSITVVTSGSLAGCTPSADDTFVVDGGALTLTGNWTQSAGNTGGINLINGGNLNVEVATTALSIATGTLGITSQSGALYADNTGGSVTLRGKYLSHRRNPAVLFDAPDEEYLEDMSSSASAKPHTWQVGDIIPCGDNAGGSDCAVGDNKYQVELRYPTSAWNTSSNRGDPRFDENMTAINAASGATNDVVCMWDVDTADSYALPEDGFCYRVVAKTVTGTTYRVVLDVRQGAWNIVGTLRDHAWRAYQPFTLLAAQTAGQSRIRMTETGIVLADRDFAGRYVRCKDSDGNWENFGYKILTSTQDAGGDYLQFAAVDEGGVGLVHDYAASTACVIGYGFQKGQSFFIMRPVFVTSANATPADDADYVGGSVAIVRATTDLAAVVLDKVRDGLVLLSTTGASVRDLWVRDPYGQNTPVMVQVLDSVSMDMRRISITGHGPNTNDATPGTYPCVVATVNPLGYCIRHHGMQFYGVASSTVDGYSARHLGDDALIFQEFGDPVFGGKFTGRAQVVNASAHNIGVTVQHVHSQYSSTYGGSGGLADWFTSRSENVLVSDVVCDDCGTRDSPIFYQSSEPDPVLCGQRVQNAVVWAPFEGGLGFSTAASGSLFADKTCYENMYVNWVPMAIASPGGFERVNGFAIFNVRVEGAPALSYIWSGVLDWRNGFYAKAYLKRATPSFVHLRNQHLAPSVIDNVALLDFTTDTVGSINGHILGAQTSVSNSVAGNSYKNITLGFTERTPRTQRQATGIALNAWTGDADTVIGSLLLTGFDANGTANPVFASAPGFATAVTVNGPLCWAGNYPGTGEEIGGTQATNLVAAGVPMYYSATMVPRSAFGTIPYADTGEMKACGASGSAGIPAMNWALSKSGLRPVTLSGYMGGSIGAARPRAY